MKLHVLTKPFIAYMARPGQYNAWTPISKLSRTDADVSIFFINQNSIRYERPVNDPVFSAHRTLTKENPDYLPDRFTNAIGCIDQMQICDSSGICTSLADFNTVQRELLQLPMSDTKQAMAKRFANSMKFSLAYYAVNGRSGAALRASELVSNLLSSEVFDHQWWIEVDSWFASSLARMQRTIFNYATMSSAFQTSKPVIDRELYSAQKIKGNSAYLNFDWINVLVLIVMCSLTILVGHTLDTSMTWCQGRQNYRKRAWKLNGFLQLQRMTQEGAGHGRWKRSQETVPTLREDKLVPLSRYTVDSQAHATIEGPTNVEYAPPYTGPGHVHICGHDTARVGNIASTSSAGDIELHDLGESSQPPPKYSR